MCWVVWSYRVRMGMRVCVHGRKRLLSVWRSSVGLDGRERTDVDWRKRRSCMLCRILRRTRLVRC